MRRWSILLLIAFLFVLTPPVKAQSPVGFDELKVLLWPEYDRPDMLVIYKITLSGSTKLPALIDLRIPKAVGSPYNVAVEEADGQLYSLNYTTSQEGEWLVISLTAPTTKLQVEYYDPGLTKTDGRREYNFRWPGDFETQDLIVQVQQPVTASNLQVEMVSGTWSTGTDGMQYYTVDVGKVPAATPVSLKLSYTKADDSLSVPDQVPLQSSQPIGPSTDQLRVQEALPFILGGLGLALIIGGGLWFWLISRKRQSGPSKRRHVSANLVNPEGVEADIYCHQCGKRAAKDDVFCRTCGTRLRRE
ncbi:MAG TPA: zinc ribbon domain-containing protein [Longilinea sp.]|nr:zinc ribbon domain-containing protein [Longilinea sp.]